MKKARFITLHSFYLILLFICLSSCKDTEPKEAPQIITKEEILVASEEKVKVPQIDTTLDKNPTTYDKKAIAKTTSEKNGEITKTNFKYNFDKASQIYILESRLTEISGLGYDRTKGKLIAQDDESGKFFVLNKNDGKIESTYKFAKKGDYEGIEVVGQNIVAVKNNGDLYFYEQKRDKTKKVGTTLTSKNDVEGLCYLEKSNQLLLACKAQGIEHEHSKKNKYVYAVNLSNYRLDQTPFITIRDHEITSFIERNQTGLSKSKLKNLVHTGIDFSPSGITYHEASKSYYILSARGSTLLILDENKNIRDFIFLNKNTIAQPEGICFDEQDNLYISTEGKGYSGKIFRFDAM